MQEDCLLSRVQSSPCYQTRRDSKTGEAMGLSGSCGPVARCLPDTSSFQASPRDHEVTQKRSGSLPPSPKLAEILVKRISPRQLFDDLETQCVQERQNKCSFHYRCQEKQLGILATPKGN